MIHLERMIVEHVAEVGGELEAWRACVFSDLIQDVFSQVTDGELIEIIQASPSPESLNLVAEFMEKLSYETEGRCGYDILSRHVENSNFELSQWMKSIALLTAWLKSQSHRSRAKDQLSYICHCADLCIEDQVNHKDLVTTVENHLEDREKLKTFKV